MKNTIVLLASALLLCCQPIHQQKTEINLLEAKVKKMEKETIWYLGYSKGVACGTRGDYCDIKSQFKKDTIRYRDMFD